MQRLFALGTVLLVSSQELNALRTKQLVTVLAQFRVFSHFSAA